MNAILDFDPEVGHDYQDGETGRTFEKVVLAEISREIAEEALLLRARNSECVYGGVTRTFLYECDGALYLEAFFNRNASGLFGRNE